MRTLIALVIIVMFSGCQDVKRPQKPDDLIAKPKMVDVLTEAYLISAARNYDLRLIRNKGVQLDSLIYTMFQIDSVQFAKSHSFYTADLNEYNDMLEEVKERLLVMQNNADSIDELIKEQRREERKQDSIAGKTYDTIIDDEDAVDERQKLVDSMRRSTQLIEPEISQ